MSFEHPNAFQTTELCSIAIQSQMLDTNQCAKARCRNSRTLVAGEYDLSGTLVRSTGAMFRYVAHTI